MPAADPAATAGEEILVPDAASWRAWLDSSHAEHPYAWVVVAKKGTTGPTRLTHDEALEEATCFGWVDGMVRGRDAATYRLRFSPRKPAGNWTPGNVALARRLIDEGRMHSAGLAAVERAKASGRFP